MKYIYFSLLNLDASRIKLLIVSRTISLISIFMAFLFWLFENRADESISAFSKLFCGFALMVLFLKELGWKGPSNSRIDNPWSRELFIPNLLTITVFSLVLIYVAMRIFT